MEKRTAAKRSVFLYVLALLLLVAFSFVMLCKSVVTVTLCNPYTEIDVTDPQCLVVDQDDTVWKTETEVNIFSIKYSNEEGVYTVISERGDKVFAPGTAQAYDFRIMNSYTAAVKYTLRAEAVFSDSEKIIPIGVRFCDYNAKYFVGSADSWASPLDLNTLSDTRTVGAGKYIRYTLDWGWPFEWGNDEYDTFLGRSAVQEDNTLTIRLYLVAEEDTTDPEEGWEAPQTGDDFNLILWGTVMGVSVVCLVFVLIYRRKAKE